MAIKICQNCGNNWDSLDDTRMYYFQSATKAIGSYTSPKEISTLGQEILFCPQCPDKDLQRVTDVLNDDKPGTGNPRGRYDDEGDREHASQGKANVVHRPIF